MIKNLTPNIRTATLDDAGAIAQIHICSWQKMYRDFIPEIILQNLSLEERTLQWRNLIEQEVKVLIMEINNQIVGFASICPFRDFSADRSMGEISAIYLHPDYWRMGLGTQLCMAAISALANQGYKKILLWVFEDNIQARKFYDALGFEATSSTKLEEFYEGGALLKEVLYQKIL
ncbi:GNAT family N-acetyltransferase [Legionella anisa]|uniref:N-acetyltransferase n=1 Tax=Legionella anisa TaxID=28082 RepID=A0AAX0WRQ4_9GAMM|nr:GNAT family N-acetyltransferase [Legionella anisa]AWN75043.1 GNAT family N-acetyltransferase [Legionella anisa]KTC69253.1 GNAT family acetyltransferase [Legionella anisa]MBN5934378.1 GNAT family N-acetyltransferase [Legionella anisa]MCW8424753.1 GNAT family N-acetyltransferase [Legionella anisa]MCW8446128.1 GNAT family N-acetyltransferase [Legionella anisa]